MDLPILRHSMYAACLDMLLCLGLRDWVESRSPWQPSILAFVGCDETVRQTDLRLLHRKTTALWRCKTCTRLYHYARAISATFSPRTCPRVSCGAQIG